jgi:hypothetical protein
LEYNTVEPIFMLTAAYLLARGQISAALAACSYPTDLDLPKIYLEPLLTCINAVTLYCIKFLHVCTILQHCPRFASTTLADLPPHVVLPSYVLVIDHLHRAPRLRIHHKLHHPHIACMRDAFLSNDQGHTVLNIVMEFVQGGTLIDYINSHRPVSENTARYATTTTVHCCCWCLLLSQACTQLQYACIQAAACTWWLPVRTLLLQAAAAIGCRCCSRQGLGLIRVDTKQQRADSLAREAATVALLYNRDAAQVVQQCHCCSFVLR